MAAIIRLKRPLNDDPLEAVLFNCKRIKTEDTNSLENEDLSTVFKLAGTIKSTEEDILPHIKKFTKASSIEQYKKHIPNVSTKLKADQIESLKNRRLKVVNSFRKANEGPSTDSSYTIFDICDDSSKAEVEYVYDLYYGEPKQLENADLNELLSVYPLSDHCIYDSDLTHDKDDPDSDYSEDSNAEGDWRNDYPDESDSMGENDSVDEGDILRAMNRVTLGGSDLSSDDSEMYGDDYDEHGKLYSKFKARYNKELDSDDEYDQSCTP